MACAHEHTVHLPVPPSHVQLSCNGVYFALPYTRSTLGVWTIANPTSKCLELEGHRKTISAICFSNSTIPTLVCSAASDYIIVWNVERAKNCLDTGQQIRGQIIATSVGEVEYLSFSSDDNLIAACVDRQVLVLDSKQEKTIAVLEGHTSQVHCAKFCPHYTATLVSAGADRTFKIWNISNSTLVYQSSIISSSPFLSIAMDPVKPHFAIGSADGQVRIYDLTDGNSFRCLHQLDVSKLQQKMSNGGKPDQPQDQAEGNPITISSRPRWEIEEANNGSQQNQDIFESGDSMELSVSIFDMTFNQTEQSKKSEKSNSPPSNLSFLNRENTLVSDLLQTGPVLAIATTSCIVQVNANTLEPRVFVNLQEPMASSSVLDESEKVISWAGNAALSRDPHYQRLWCLVGSCFQNEVHLLELREPSKDAVDLLQSKLSSSNTTCSVQHAHDSSLESNESSSHLSVLSSTPLSESSPLKSQLVLKEKTPKKKTQKGSLAATHVATPGIVSKKGEIVDNQPITFKSAVKSSGYAAEQPRQVMFQPKTSSSKSKQSPKSKSSNGLSSIIKDYPVDSSPPTEFKSKIDVAERPTAINSIQFSSDGSNCACALANTSAQVFKLPLTGKGCAFTGHKGIVSNVDWSHDNQWLLTSSEDRTACLWSLTVPDPVMTFNTVNNNFGVDKEGGMKSDKENPLFSKPVKFGQFYYVDKFILLTCGDSFYMYKYHLDSSKSDIKRYLSNNRFKLVKKFNLTDAHNITAFTAINAFHSYLTICAGSDKSLEVFDMNIAQSVKVIKDVHTRPVHCIALNQGSQYSSLASSAYDLFVTAASSDCIKLWDLRTCRCVRKYEGHTNRMLPCGVKFSPCSRFIATGSEDRSAYIYDIRAGTYLHKLTGHTDAVANVAFHPLHPMLVTATLDGKLRTFLPP